MDLGARARLKTMTTTVAEVTWSAREPAALPPAAPRVARGARHVGAYGSHLLLLRWPDRGLVAKRMPTRAAAEAAFALAAQLAAHCAHVPAPTLLEAGDGITWWVATEYLEGGRWLDANASVEAAALALARLHAAMRMLPAQPIRDAGAARAARVLAWLQAHEGDEEVRSLGVVAGLDAAALRAALERHLAGAAQPVHHDLHEGNTWWSRGQVWFLDLEETGSSHLPVAADLMRFIERQLLLPRGPAEGAAAGREFWRRYHAHAGMPAAGADEAYAALAWNWLDSWAALHSAAPSPASFAAERRKFLALLRFHVAHWRQVVDTLVS